MACARLVLLVTTILALIRSLSALACERQVLLVMTMLLALLRSMSALAPRAVAFLVGAGMCMTGFAGSGMSKRPKKPGTMDGGVSMPGIAGGTNLKVGFVGDNFIEF